MYHIPSFSRVTLGCILITVPCIEMNYISANKGYNYLGWFIVIVTLTSNVKHLNLVV